MSLAAWYPVVKHVHMTCAAATLLLFTLRGAWMMRGSPRLGARWVRVLPHVVDTVLLGSAILLAWLIGNAPLTHGWLTAKVTGLVLYIVLGTVALKRGRTLRIRIAAFVAALLVFGYIVAVAFTKSPWGYFAL
ncbi:MAG: SirB2 family protein [Burkholderiales bacterium]